MRIIAAVRRVAGGAALFEGRLVQVFLLKLLGLVRVADQTPPQRGRAAEKPGDLPACGVAIRAVACRSRMLHLAAAICFRHIFVAHHAQGLHILLRQHHLPSLAG